MDGRPDCRIKSAFSNFFGVLWTGPEIPDSYPHPLLGLFFLISKNL